jgi:hypothetical protein
MVRRMRVPAGRSDVILIASTCLFARHVPEIVAFTGWLQPALQHWPTMHIGVAGRFGQKSDGTGHVASGAFVNDAQT